MARRIRTVKPEWLEDELMALASSDARVLSIALILLADDYGRGRANLVMLAGQVFPGKPIEVLKIAVNELCASRYISIYDVDGQSYFQIRNWSKHQRVEHAAGGSKFPDPLDTDSGVSPHEEEVRVRASRDPILSYPIPDHSQISDPKSQPETTRKIKARESELSDSFVISADHLEYANGKGWPEWWIRLTFDSFCDMAKAKGWKYVNWNMAFYTFCRNQLVYKKGPAELIHLAPKVASGPTAAQQARDVALQRSIEVQRVRERAEAERLGLPQPESGKVDMRSLLSGVGN